MRIWRPAAGGRLSMEARGMRISPYQIFLRASMRAFTRNAGLVARSLDEFQQAEGLRHVKVAFAGGLPGDEFAAGLAALAAVEIDAHLAAGGRLSMEARGMRISPYQIFLRASMRAFTRNAEFQSQPPSGSGFTRSISRSTHSPCGETSNSL